MPPICRGSQAVRLSTRQSAGPSEPEEEGRCCGTLTVPQGRHSPAAVLPGRCREPQCLLERLGRPREPGGGGALLDPGPAPAPGSGSSAPNQISRRREVQRRLGFRAGSRLPRSMRHGRARALRRPAAGSRAERITSSTHWPRRPGLVGCVGSTAGAPAEPLSSAPGTENVGSVDVITCYL